MKQNKLPETLKKLLKKNKMTQCELSKKIYVSNTGISFWTQGKRSPAIDQIIQLAEIFNVSIDYLLTGEEYEK